jgi:hypothetical protein
MAATFFAAPRVHLPELGEHVALLNALDDPAVL